MTKLLVTKVRARAKSHRGKYQGKGIHKTPKTPIWTSEEEEFYQEMIQKTKDEAERMKINHNLNVLEAKGEYITSPIYVTIERKTMEWKKIALNMNWYRNVDPMINNNVKHIYKELMKDQIKDLKYDDPIHVHYKIFWSTKPDGMNIASVISKFLLDAMQLHKDKKTGEISGNDCIPDDNIELVTESYSNGGKDLNNPRVEIYITKQNTNG